MKLNLRHILQDKDRHGDSVLPRHIRAIRDQIAETPEVANLRTSSIYFWLRIDPKNAI
jgi:hypothetical protein